jgi:transcriptional regulator
VRHNPEFEVTDPGPVRELIRANPWATLVSANDGLVASHYPVLLDEEADGMAILTHVGRPDEEVHGFGAGEVLCIVQGTHGYISPSWYASAEGEVPTWNFTVAHLYGVPEVLGGEENLRVLTRLVDHFERRVESPHPLDPEFGAQLARGTVGVRIPISRFLCKRKLSQNKDEANRRGVIAALRAPGPYRHPELAEEIERELDA